MGYLMMNVDKVNDLSVREKKLTEYLRKIEEWEAEVIMEGECWNNTYPMLTKKMYDKWIELQKERNELLG